MTKSIWAQKLFLRLSSNQRKHWGIMRRIPRSFKRNPSWNKVFPSPNYIRVEIINAVTGEKTTALAIDNSKRSLKKWLRIRNMRAQFASMILKPKSSWVNFSPEEWENFPVIVRVGDTQFPYAVSHLGEKITIKDKISCSVYLKILDNINYLSVVNSKKKLMKEWIEKHPVRTKKKAKRKKRMDYDFDE